MSAKLAFVIGVAAGECLYTLTHGKPLLATPTWMDYVLMAVAVAALLYGLWTMRQLNRRWREDA